MKRLFFPLIILSIFSAFSVSAQFKTENVFIITTDGMRWQEVFSGADSTLIFDKRITADSAKTVGKFWAKTPAERREKIFPFLWNTIAKSGQLYGNRLYNNYVNVRNPYWFSYPGYNEILSGFADEKVNSNDKTNNENLTILEYLNNTSAYKTKVAAFTTWDCFPYIINESRSEIPVNSGIETVNGQLTEKELLLNQLLTTVPSLASDRFDFITYYLAKEYLIKKQPNIMFLAFDETDEMAHENKYREYLTSANNVDKYIADLWGYCQNNPKYKDKTTFIITTDHGRGDIVKRQWTSHGQKVLDSNQIWLAVIGPDTKPLGELKTEGQLYQNQIAQTISTLLGYDFSSEATLNHQYTGSAILSILK